MSVGTILSSGLGHILRGICHTAATYQTFDVEQEEPSEWNKSRDASTLRFWPGPSLKGFVFKQNEAGNQTNTAIDF